MSNLLADERGKWDKRVFVSFQPKAWVDTKTSVLFVEHVIKPVHDALNEQILVFEDNLGGHIHDTTTAAWEQHCPKAKVIFYPRNMTSKLQCVDLNNGYYVKRLVYAGFRKEIMRRRKAGKSTKLSASEKRILITKIVAEAVDLLYDSRHCIDSSFVRTSTWTKMDGSDDKNVKPQRLEGYSMSEVRESARKEFQNARENLLRDKKMAMITAARALKSNSDPTKTQGLNAAAKLATVETEKADEECKKSLPGTTSATCVCVSGCQPVLVSAESSVEVLRLYLNDLRMRLETDTLTSSDMQDNDDIRASSSDTENNDETADSSSDNEGDDGDSESVEQREQCTGLQITGRRSVKCLKWRKINSIANSDRKHKHIKFTCAYVNKDCTDPCDYCNKLLCLCVCTACDKVGRRCQCLSYEDI